MLANPAAPLTIKGIVKIRTKFASLGINISVPDAAPYPFEFKSRAALYGE
jgi:hypothetical protein